MENDMWKRLFNLNLRNKLNLYCYILSLVPLIIICIFFYKISTDIIKEKVGSYDYSTMNNIRDSIDFIMEDIRGLSRFFIANVYTNRFLTDPQQNVQSYEKVENTYEVNNMLIYMMNAKSYIKSIFISGFNGSYIMTNSLNRREVDDDTIKSLKLSKEPYKWSGPVKKISSAGFVTNVIYLERLINDINRPDRTIGYMCIDIDEKFIYNLYTSKLIGHSNNFFMVDNNWKVLSSVNKKLLGKTLDSSITEVANGRNDGYFLEKINGQQTLITISTIKMTGWKIINLIPTSKIAIESSVVGKMIFLVAIVVVLISFIITYLFSYEVLKPLNKLNSLMGNVEKDNFKIRFNYAKNDEIGQLANSFNKMVERINTLIYEVYEVEINQKEMQIKVLQAQINPHFLYNSLNNLKWMAIMQQADAMEDIISSLSSLLYYNIDYNKDMVCIHEEIKQLNNYIKIQKVRYLDKFQVKFSIPKEFEDYKMMKFILQPIVENAIFHGIAPKDEKGLIIISAFRVDQDIMIVVQDDGVGIDIMKSRITSDSLDKYGFIGVGLRNINERLKLRFGPQYGISIESKPDMGMRVELLFPIIE
ncbi:MAG: sensor histidine kinase [Ruminiclostridium sp.]|nr:sensor histidine kinase [Ruminiclostridium sp.]